MVAAKTQNKKDCLKTQTKVKATPSKASRLEKMHKQAYPRI